ncbi:MAG TPA: DUF58 domain-containing protein [Gammaproteobacteria bacterium]|nr:DUF58 domain-containing protein [Gammaproteobacteria bacterium]
MFTALRARFRRRMREWARSRQGPDGRRVTIVQRRLYILPTPQGLLYGVAVFVMMLASMNYANSMGFMLVFLLASLGMVAMNATHANLLGLELEAVSVTPVFAGETARFQVKVANPGKQPRTGVTLGAEEDERTLTSDIPVMSDSLAPVPFLTTRRGWQPIGRLSVETSYPLALFRAWSWVYMDWRVLVYPAPAIEAPPLPVPLGGRGLGRPNDQGEDDFSGLRAYQPGDSPRRIAWKASAREQELLTKRFSGTGEEARWFDWSLLPALGEEARLSVLCRWVLEAHAEDLAYGLRLPGTQIAPAAGDEQRDRCLKVLALHGLGTESEVSTLDGVKPESSLQPAAGQRT